MSLNRHLFGGIILAKEQPANNVAINHLDIPMKRSIFLSLAIATTAFLQPLSLAQATDPVGFNTVNVAPGTAAALSFPLDNIASFVGPVSSRTATTITSTSANFGTFGPFSSNPHVVRMLSGANEGRQFRIDSNTSETLTITTGGDLTTSIANLDRYEVLKVNTLASFFGATAPSLNVNGNVNLADNVLIRSGPGWLTYYNSGTQWLRQGGGPANQNNVAMLPENGILLARRAGTALSFTVVGAVPVSDLRTDLPANASTFLGNRFPADVTLVDLGLHAIPGWSTNGNVNLADNVLTRTPSGWLTYYHNGTQWLRQGAGPANQNGTIIPIGTAVLVARRAGTNVTFIETPPY